MNWKSLRTSEHKTTSTGIEVDVDELGAPYVVSVEKLFKLDEVQKSLDKAAGILAEQRESSTGRK